MSAGKFVCAALPSVYMHTKNALLDFPEDITAQQTNSFLHSNTNKFLTSIGIILHKKGCEIEDKRIKRYIRMLKIYRNTEFLKGCELIVDSGGYQIQQGFLKRKTIPEFIDMYHDDFLPNQYKLFDKAFMLDIAPGSVSCPFDSYEDMKQLNEYSYSKVKNMSDDLKSKMIYIHHFRTPRIHDIYKDLLFKQNMAEGIKNFSTGGIVSFLRTGSGVPPYILYIIPMIEILDYAIKTGLKKFRFHVLGGAEWKEILGHKFFERHIKELFDIDVEITFDSSTFFRTVCMGRYTFNYTEDRKISKMSIRPDELQLRSITNKEKTNSSTTTRGERFCEMVNAAIDGHGITPMDSSVPIYSCRYCNFHYEDISNTNKCPKCGRVDSHSFSRLYYMYSLFQLLHIMSIVEDWSKDIVDEAYGKFNSTSLSDNVEFNNIINRHMINLQGAENMNRRNIEFKSLAVHNSLKLLSEYKDNPKKALEKCDMIVNKYMAGSECEQLSNDRPKSFDCDGITKGEKPKRKRVRKPKEFVLKF